MFYDNRNIIKRGIDVKNSKARNTHQKALSPTSDFFEDIDRDTVAQAYEHIVQFLHRYKNNIEFVTKEELVAVTNIKEPIITRVLDKLRKREYYQYALKKIIKIFLILITILIKII